jgi:hypothetical protein
VKPFRCMTEEEYNTRHLKREPATLGEWVAIVAIACIVVFLMGGGME